MQILIDPGHGGPDNLGATAGDFVESIYNLDLSYLLLETMDALGIPCAMTRLGNVTMPLSDRGDYGKMCDAGVTLCLHVNAHDNPTMHGLMTFVLPDDYKAYQLATTIGNATPATLKRQRNDPYICYKEGWTKNAHNVLAPHQGRVPVLVEVGFATNKSDLKFIESDAGMRSVVSALALGICEHACRHEPLQ